MVSVGRAAMRTGSMMGSRLVTMSKATTTTRTPRATTTSTSSAAAAVGAPTVWAAFVVGFVVGAGVARRTFAVVIIVIHLGVLRVIVLGVLLAGRVLVLIVTAFVRGSSTIRHSPTTAEELLTPSPRTEGFLRTLVVFAALMLVLGLIVPMLGEEWVLRALLLKVCDEVPEGS
jgi:hypothetical protein